MFGKLLKSMMPEVLVRLHPLADLPQRLGLHVIMVLAPNPALDDESRLLQDAQMLRDGGPTHSECLRELLDGHIMSGNKIKQAPPCGVGNCVKDIDL
jgi:hypothetical protein